jgi:hypothetical protein
LYLTILAKITAKSNPEKTTSCHRGKLPKRQQVVIGASSRKRAKALSGQAPEKKNILPALRLT